MSKPQLMLTRLKWQILIKLHELENRNFSTLSPQEQLIHHMLLLALRFFFLLREHQFPSMWFLLQMDSKEISPFKNQAFIL